MEYYVYVAKCGDEVVYVGSGSGDRLKHVNSWRSHNEELNKSMRMIGPLNVTKVLENVSKAKAVFEEQKLIDFYKPKYNKARPYGVSHEITNSNYRTSIIVLETEYLKLSKLVSDGVEDKTVCSEASNKMQVLLESLTYIERCCGESYAK